MKKLIVLGLAGFVMVSSSFAVSAAEQYPACEVSGCSIGDCFADTDGDGICGDHCFVDENGDGICDNHCYTDCNEDSICDYFVDEDEDGVCDHCHDHGKPVAVSSNRSTRSSCHQRSGGHHGRRHHHCY